MKQIPMADFRQYHDAAAHASGDAVYPLSIAEGVQSGDIFIGGDAVLFWHNCGFAYLSGHPEPAFLNEIAVRFFGGTQPERRFLLISDDADVCRYFAAQRGILAEQRVYYHADAACAELQLPEGFSLHRTDAELLPRITGRIVPAWSWDAPEQFLANGIGYCVMHGETVAAAAFTAAVSSDFADIGVETAADFRRMGLAKAAAAAVMREITAQGKTPVWAHHLANTGSMRTAEAIGFQRDRICMTFRREYRK